jgi:CHASE3 domain sensor protein
MFATTTIRIALPERRTPVLHRKIFVAIGVLALLVMTAASVALDIRSRSEGDHLDSTLSLLNRISNLRLLLRSAESGARGYLISGAPYFLNDYHQAHDSIAPAFADLTKLLRPTLGAQIEIQTALTPEAATAYRPLAACQLTSQLGDQCA